MRRALLAAAFGVAAVAAACNAIVGVQDVRLARGGDGGVDEDAGEELDSSVALDGDIPIPKTGLVVAAGGAHTCARLKDGKVRCWGENTEGELGNGQSGTISRVPVSVQVVNDAQSVCAGLKHSCAIRADRSVYCWGYNLNGQLGNGATGQEAIPVKTTGLPEVVQISCGSNFTCAVTTKGAVFCWGGNGNGQLGQGNTVGSSTPKQVVNVAGAVQVAAGSTHACAVTTTGTVSCWGNNDVGQLGTGTTASELSARQLPGVTGVSEIAAGAGFTCFRLGGAIQCAGANDKGQLGRGTADTGANSTPKPVIQITDAVGVAAGASHACAMRGAGRISCWGSNGFGQLGNGTVLDDGGIPTPTPQTVGGVSDAVTLGLGDRHSCHGNQASRVLCWGANDLGQIGQPDGGNSYTPDGVDQL
ncbi:MAG: hypothetical protein JNL38_27570 [Myxococcales bacterium]|nr:hypothetical protein [Myxococcales bacterium]